MNINVVDQPLSTFDGSFSNKAIRSKFISKVFTIVALELCVTIAISLMFMNIQNFKDYAIKNLYFIYLFLIAAFVILLLLSCSQTIARSYPLNIILLTAHAALEGFAIGFISSFLNTYLVAYAFIITATAAFAIAVFSILTDIDLTRCQPLLCILFVVFVIMMSILVLVMTFTGHPLRFWHMVMCAGGALLSILYFAIEVQMIFGGKRYELNPEDYIIGALCIYVDLINIFIYILQILRYFEED